jgi:uncharacterized protein (DUF58 family)
LAEPHATRLQRDAEGLTAALPPLLLAAERVAATVAQGVHGRRRVGQGETFWQFRRYEYGDPPQTIDWRQSAKRQALFVRQMEWEAAQTVWLYRDGSASMAYRSSSELPTKLERADLLALALAILLCRAGERVSLAGSGLAPSSGRQAIERLAAELVHPTGDQAAAAATMRDALPRYAHLVMIGDFLAPLEETEAAIRGFVERGVRGHLLHVLDPAEETLPFKGRVRFTGLENEAPWTLSRVEEVRPEYLDRLAMLREGLRDIARYSGWSYSAHRTDRPPQTALMALFSALARSPGS